MPGDGPIDWSEMRSATSYPPGHRQNCAGTRADRRYRSDQAGIRHSGSSVSCSGLFYARRQAHLHVHQLPELLGEEARGERRETSTPSPFVPPSSSLAPRPSSLRLMTIRSEGQFNTVVYEDYDLYRGVERRDVILLHADDINAARVDGRPASPCEKCCWRNGKHHRSRISRHSPRQRRNVLPGGQCPGASHG